MDGPPAQSLGVEAVEPEVTRRPPRPRSEPIITASLLRRVVLAAAVIVAGTLAVFWREVGDGPGHTRRDTTMTFTTFVMFDMFNALSCRASERSVFSIGFFSNPFFCFAVGGSLLGQLAVVYAPPLQAVFQTEALAGADWARIVAITSTVLWVDEGVKLWRRRRAARRRGGAGGDGGAGAGAAAQVRAAVLRAPRALQAPLQRVLDAVGWGVDPAGRGGDSGWGYSTCEYKRSDDLLLAPPGSASPPPGGGAHSV